VDRDSVMDGDRDCERVADDVSDTVRLTDDDSVTVVDVDAVPLLLYDCGDGDTVEEKDTVLDIVGVLVIVFVGDGLPEGVPEMVGDTLPVKLEDLVPEGDQDGVDVNDVPHDGDDEVESEMVGVIDAVLVRLGVRVGDVVIAPVGEVDRDTDGVSVGDRVGVTDIDGDSVKNAVFENDAVRETVGVTLTVALGVVDDLSLTTPDSLVWMPCCPNPLYATALSVR
jgi:hypothetical protein